MALGARRHAAHSTAAAAGAVTAPLAVAPSSGWLPAKPNSYGHLGGLPSMDDRLPTSPAAPPALRQPSRGRATATDLAAFRCYRRTGDGRLREELIGRYMPLARTLARRYRHTSEPLDDLDQVAALGLVKAVDRWTRHADAQFRGSPSRRSSGSCGRPSATRPGRCTSAAGTRSSRSASRTARTPSPSASVVGRPSPRSLRR